MNLIYHITLFLGIPILMIGAANPTLTPTSRPTNPTHSPTSAPTTVGPILYLPLEGNATDVSGYNHTTFVQGSVSLTTDRYGNANGAYSFAYAGQIQVVDSQLLSIGTNDYTIAMWIKSTNAITNTAPGFLFAHGSTVSCSISGYQLSIVNNYIFQGMSCPGGCAFQNTGTTLLSNGVWYFIVNTVKRGGYATVYINGEVDSAVSNVSSCDLNDYRTNVNGVKNKGVFIGGDVGNYQFYGAIDDVQIYNRALSSSEVKALYAQTTVPPTPLPTTYPSYAGLTDPILHLPFDGNASDVSGYNHVTHVQNSTFLTTDRFGNANGAYRFAYAGQIQVIDSDLLAIGSDDYSISMWIKSTQASTNTGRLFSHGSAQSCSVSGYQLSLAGSYLYQEMSCPSGCALQSKGNTLITNNVWYFVTNTVQRGGLASLYVNGILDTAVSNISRCDLRDYRVNNVVRVKDKGVYVGGDVGTYQFYGSIDEVKIFNRALSAAEVSAMYYASAGSVPTATPTTSAPSVLSTAPPTSSPSTLPTVSPTGVPTATPTYTPSSKPTSPPTKSPTTLPTLSNKPTNVPSKVPSISPTFAPTFTPTLTPSTATPTTGTPTFKPTAEPSFSPSKLPSVSPTVAPSKLPTYLPSKLPTVLPTTKPSSIPTTKPSSFSPTFKPSSFAPTLKPTLAPTATPSTSQGCYCLPYCMSNPYCFYPTSTPTTAPNPSATLQALCSRCSEDANALNTGIYSMHTGLQNYCIEQNYCKLA